MFKWQEPSYLHHRKHPGNLRCFCEPAPSLQWHSYCKPTISSTLQTNFFPSKLHEGMGKNVQTENITQKSDVLQWSDKKKICFIKLSLFLCKGQLAHVSVSWGLFVLFPFWKRSGEKSQEMRVKSRWFPPGSCFECCSKGLPRQCKAVSLLIAFH